MAMRGTILIGDPAVRARAARGPRLARRTVERSALLALVWLLILMFAREMVITWGVPDPDLLDPFADANTYLAAGERLNDGHPLYALQPGDRPVLLVGEYPVPLFSPPPIAAIWRPLAIVPFGFRGLDRGDVGRRARHGDLSRPADRPAGGRRHRRARVPDR